MGKYSGGGKNIVGYLADLWGRRGRFRADIEAGSFLQENPQPLTQLQLISGATHIARNFNREAALNWGLAVVALGAIGWLVAEEEYVPAAVSLAPTLGLYALARRDEARSHYWKQQALVVAREGDEAGYRRLHSDQSRPPRP